jgi:hypothetical protein
MPGWLPGPGLQISQHGWLFFSTLCLPVAEASQKGERPKPDRASQKGRTFPKWMASTIQLLAGFLDARRSALPASRLVSSNFFDTLHCLLPAGGCLSLCLWLPLQLPLPLQLSKLHFTFFFSLFCCPKR